MEDRVADAPSERPGLALTALVVILVVTAAWWALAFFPSGGAEPDWLARTRSACFGSAHGGLPDAGGWILLIGEPAGMIVALYAGWRAALKRDLALIRTRRVWCVAAAAAGILVIAGLAATGVRVARMTAAGRDLAAILPGTPVQVNTPLPMIALVDQRGERHTLHELGDGPALLTFAFAHCTSVCPATVSDLRAARRTALRADIPIVVVTLDPWRDTPDRLPTIAKQWMLAPNDRVVSGEIPNVERVLDVLGIGRQRDETTGDVEHPTTVMMIEHGRISWRVEGGVGSVTELLARTAR